MDVSTSTRRFTEKSAAQAKGAFNKAAVATSEEARRVEDSALTAMNGVREFYLRMLDMAQDNTVTGFDVARELASVKTPSEFMELWNTRVREVCGTFSEQAKELSGLAQKAATSTVQPLANGLINPFRQVS